MSRRRPHRHPALRRRALGAFRLRVLPRLAWEVGAALKHEMEGVYQLSVPLEVDIGIADNWADA